MQLLRFPILSGSAESQVIWYGIVKCLDAKKVSKSLQMCQSYSKQRWDVFLTHCVHSKNRLELETVSIAEPLQNRQLAQNP